MSVPGTAADSPGHTHQHSTSSGPRTTAGPACCPEAHRLPAPACVFCRIIAGTAPATAVREWDNAVAILPLDGVTEGHVLVLPRRHVANALVDPHLTGQTMTRAAELGAELDSDLNLITSVGPAATQTVHHLHIHLVPRAAGDGLPLPWTPQQAAAQPAAAPG